MTTALILDDDVYYDIGERPKLERETEKSGNWAEKPGSTNLRFDTYSWQLPARAEGIVTALTF